MATTDTLITVENKVPSVSNLVEKANYNTKSSETGEKITDMAVVISILLPQNLIKQQ